MPNAISWFEIPANDIARAKRFYETLFLSKMEELKLPNGLKMAFFPMGEGEVSGALAELKGYYHPSHDGSLVYLNGEPDLTVVLNRVVPAGGKILQAKTQISPEVGYMALFEDTEGNRVALFSRG